MSNLKDNLVSYWKLDGNSNDSVGGNNGVDTAVSYGISYGKIKQGMLGNGLTSKIQSTFSFAPTAFSISWWVYPTTISNYNSQMLAVNSWNSFVFHTTSTGGIYCGTDLATRFSITELPTGTLTQDVWNHIVYTYDGANGRFYKNGILLATKAQTAPVDFGGMKFGSGDSNTINGALDEVGLWSRALSLTEIQSLYNGGLGLSYPFNLEYTNETKNVVSVTNEQNKIEPQRGLVAYYKLDEISGNAVDSVAGNNGVNTSVKYEAGKINNGARFKSCFADLLAYYKFDEASGNAIDSIGGYTLTNQGVTYETGKINNAARFRSCFYGLSYYWKFDEASGNAVDLCYAKELVNSNVTYAASKINNGAVFNGTTAQYTIASGLTISKTAFTINLWMKPELIGGIGYSMLLLIGNGTDLLRLFPGDTGEMEFDQVNGEIGNVRMSGLTFGAWQMITIAFDGTTTTMYKNGVSVASAISPYTFNPLTSMVISDAAGAPYKGGLDELGIWSRCLSTNDITELYNATAGLAYALPSKLSAAAPVIPLGAKTISFWLKTTYNNIFTSPTIIQNCNFFGAQHGTAIIIDEFTNIVNRGKLLFGFRDTVTSIQWLSTSMAVNDGVMRHITCTWDGTTTTNAAKIYVNGVLDWEGTFETTETIAPTFNLSVGADIGGSAVLTGLIDEVGIWNRALGQAEITDLYNASVGLALASPSRLLATTNGLPAIEATKSVSFWFNIYDLYTVTRTILGLYNSVSSPTSSFQVVLSTIATGSKIRVTKWGGAVVADSDFTPVVNTWYHCVVTYDGTNTRIYIDGVLKTASSTAVQTGNTVAFDINSYPAGTTEFITGKIDEVGIWNRAITATEVLRLYNAGAGLKYPPSIWTNEAK
jgi:hypothetical protein